MLPNPWRRKSIRSKQVDPCKKSNVTEMINMKFDSDMKFCQSCAMPMTEEYTAATKTAVKTKITAFTAMKMVNLQQIYLWKK